MRAKWYKYEFKNPDGMVVYATIQYGRMKKDQQYNLIKQLQVEHKTKLKIYEKSI
jgi:hypothetical protein